MSLTPEQARDDILTAFAAAWASKTPAVNGGAVPPVKYDQVASSEPPQDTPWARVTVMHATGTQRSMGTVGSRLFSRTGVVTVQVFVPGGQGLALADRLGKIALDAFEGQHTPGDVWFRDATLREVGPDGPWWQTNVVATFAYDEQK